MNPRLHEVVKSDSYQIIGFIHLAASIRYNSTGVASSTFTSEDKSRNHGYYVSVSFATQP